MIVFLRFLLITCFVSVTFAQDQTLEVNPGTTVKLQCRPTSTRPDIPTTYQWFDPSSVAVVGYNENLVITNFLEQNVGTYTCKASQFINGVEAKSERSLFVKLKNSVGGGGGGVNLQVNVPQVYDSFANGIIFMQCKTSSGNEGFKFEWITPTGERQQTSTFFKNKATLRDSGRYVCRVTRLSDNAMTEATTFVNIQQIPIKIESSGSQIMGGIVTLNCQVEIQRLATKVFGGFRYEWIDPNGQTISQEPLLNLRLVDYTKFGIYTCRITADGPSPQYTQEQKVEIRSSGGGSGGSGGGNGAGSGNGQSTTYTASFNNNPSIVRFFQQFELNCQVRPQLLDAKYRILFNNQEISSSYSYVIPRVEKEHMGVYECTVQGRDPNSGQMVNLKSTYTIQPEYRSEVRIELAPPPGPQMTVRAGEKKELHCEITGDSIGRDAVWYFDGRELKEDQLSRYNIQVLPRLYVSIAVLGNIQTINQGRYECRVKGEVKEVYIIVMTKTKNIEVNPSAETRTVGDVRPIEFHCRIDGYSTKNRDLIWTFKSSSTGMTTSLDNRWNRTDDNAADETSFVLLRRIEAMDDGTYICTEPTTRDTARAVLTVKNEMRIVVTPPVIKLRVGGTATVQCYVLNAGRSPSYPEFTLGLGRSSANDFRMTTQRLEAGKIQLQYNSVTANDNGTEFFCRHGTAIGKSMLLVDPVCTAGFRLCRNGQCINSAKFCDGRQDCSDGSDEDLKYCRSCDPLTKRCEISGGQQPTTSYYQVHWTCDGEDDCGNGFDESRCFGNVLTCGGLNYRCNDGTKNIPRAFMCDKDRDCPNGDDEDRCMDPMIISEQTPSYQLNVKRGETLTLTCQARGYPLPNIIWRYNWGCLTDENRMVVTDAYRDCSSTVSTLTISNVQPGDDGIYNCEALSAGKRAWSKDYQVLMDFKN